MTHCKPKSQDTFYFQRSIFIADDRIIKLHVFLDSFFDSLLFRICSFRLVVHKYNNFLSGCIRLFDEGFHILDQLSLDGIFWTASFSSKKKKQVSAKREKIDPILFLIASVVDREDVSETPGWVRWPDGERGGIFL